MNWFTSLPVIYFYFCSLILGSCHQTDTGNEIIAFPEMEDTYIYISGNTWNQIQGLSPLMLGSLGRYLRGNQLGDFMKVKKMFYWQQVSSSEE